VVAVTALAVIAVTVTFPITDPDLWQHLAAGRYLWEARAVPHTQIWTWPAHGAPDIFPSWLFRAVLWPFWKVLGPTGLYVFKWVTTLSAFGVLILTARRMGAGGAAPFVIAALAALTWRQRSMIRPEMLAAVLLALEIALLEARRLGSPSRLPFLGAVFWLWVQCHISFPFGIAALVAYWSVDLLGRPDRGASPWRRRLELPLVGAVALALAAVNPVGPALLVQPLDFLFHQRGEAVMASIWELAPPKWSDQLRNGLPLLVAGWPLLAIARSFRRGWDPAEWILCAVFTWAGLTTQRFLGFYALVAVPFVARDLAQLIPPSAAGTGVMSWRAAVMASLFCVAISVPEWLRPTSPVAMDLDVRGFPVHGSDFMKTHDVRGHGFNTFDQGGYLLWRFFPDSTRLPFMDVHQAGTPEIRERYARALYDRGAWRDLDERFAFDYVILRRTSTPRDSLLEFLDTDPGFVPVFLDDDAALYVRRPGRLGAVADSFGYRLLPGGPAALQRLGQSVGADSARRELVRTELRRSAASSPRRVRALTLLANLSILEAEWDEARRLLLEAVALDPATSGAWERLGIVAEQTGDLESALRDFERERRNEPRRPGIEYRLGRVQQALGRADAARRHYERELRRDPGFVPARDSLRVLEGARR